MNRKLFTFEDFWTPERLARFRSRATQKRVSDGSVLLWHDDESTMVYLIEEGRVKKCHVTDAGNIIVLQESGRGELVGAGGAIARMDRTAYTIACGECVLWTVSNETFVDMLYKDTELAIYVAMMFARQSHENQQFSHSAMLPAKQRIALILIRLAERSGAAVNGRVRVDVTHHTLAEMTASCRQTISRTLKTFKQKGILLTQKGYLEILDMEALQREISQES